MNLAGDYASANHEIIHRKVTSALGAIVLAQVENHHKMSRTQAIKTISRADMKAILNANGVTLVGAGLDEAPMAYKDIRAVMAAQEDLVDVVATFTPKMVRMADDGSRED